MVTYYGALSDKPISEYLTVRHPGYAGSKAMQTFLMLASKSEADTHELEYATLEQASEIMNAATPPAVVKYRMDGKYHRILNRSWN